MQLVHNLNIQRRHSRTLSARWSSCRSSLRSPQWLRLSCSLCSLCGLQSALAPHRPHSQTQHSRPRHPIRLRWCPGQHPQAPTHRQIWDGCPPAGRFFSSRLSLARVSWKRTTSPCPRHWNKKSQLAESSSCVQGGMKITHRTFLSCSSDNLLGSGRIVSLMMSRAPGLKEGINWRRIFTTYASGQSWKTQR